MDALSAFLFGLARTTACSSQAANSVLHAAPVYQWPRLQKAEFCREASSFLHKSNNGWLPIYDAVDCDGGTKAHKAGWRGYAAGMALRWNNANSGANIARHFVVLKS